MHAAMHNFHKRMLGSGSLKRKFIVEGQASFPPACMMSLAHQPLMHPRSAALSFRTKSASDICLEPLKSLCSMSADKPHANYLSRSSALPNSGSGVKAIYASTSGLWGTGQACWSNWIESAYTTGLSMHLDLTVRYCWYARYHSASASRHILCCISTSLVNVSI